ncbi:type IV toxin-antitoxin system AbiEi family antitoxin domain-containing protein [Microbacterium sp. RURRCA19A]|uniref:type IV toxin-antitoxin system AbiEi family antitoxin domain-containing protein n=1 Tax=Microbacterium sp. RURRCA19A TaxID=1907391 RepID=UPI000957273B|nr:type IV toxin-antitoxin system AbiEi family antitoxin domain-containing protein [Microbacterium sp. RURRCA19A]SIR79867.1 Transcriptional regulator, AbiEi antitoxin, Type IV TA system [Microbacterium sp. RURRCA19A]
MVNDVDALRAIERAPLRTVRPQDLESDLSHARRTIARLVDRGALVRLAKGVYAAPPEGRDGRQWRPTLETAGLAVATARFGNRNAILMGLGAARHWAAIPRAIGATTVAIPEAGRPPVTLDGGGMIHLIPRDVERLDAALEQNELGRALVTTPAQTLYDLLMKPGQGGMPDEALAAARHLRGQVGPADLRRVVDTLGRANPAVRDVLNALEREVPRVEGA